MLSAASSAAPLADVQRLASGPRSSAGEAIDWSLPIDRTQWFLCETLTPLYYTRIYRELPLEWRRRYNQLTGLLANELIALLETEFLHAALHAVESAGADDPALAAAVARFKDDERRHAEIWDRLNRLSEPDWYSSRHAHLVQVPAYASSICRFVVRHPVAFPVVFWIQLVQEERSIEISRRCMRLPPDRIEWRYRAVYAAHLRDEARHVQIDRHLIERFYRPRSRMVRLMTARLFREFLCRFLLTPASSTTAVVRRLVVEYPDLAPLVPRMLSELRGLTHDDAYHEMMYSRDTTPVTFDLFDRFEEFHPMRHVLRAYHPRPVVACA